MISIKVNKLFFLALFPETSFTFQSDASFISEDSIPGQIIYPFDIPGPPNAENLEFPHIPSAVQPTNRTWDVDVFLKGRPWLSGKMKVTTSSRNKYSISIVSGPGALLDIKDKSLRDIPCDTISIEYDTYKMRTYTLKPTTKDALDLGTLTLVFISLNGFYYEAVCSSYETALANITDAINADSANNKCTCEVFTSAYGAERTIKLTATEPGPDTDIIVLAEETEDGGWWFFWLDHTDPFSTKIQDYMKSTVDGTLDSPPIVFPTFFNSEFYGDTNKRFGNVINYYSSGAFPSNTDENISEHTAVPFPSLVYVLRKIFQNGGFTVHGSFMTDEEIMTALLYSNVSIDKFANVFWIAGTPLDTFVDVNVLSNVINIANHLPDVSVSDFFNGLKDFFSLCFFFNTLEKRATLIPFRDIAKSVITEDWTNKVSTDPESTPNESNGFIFSHKNSDDALSERLLAPLDKLNVTSPVNAVGDLPVTGFVKDEVKLVKNIGQYFKATIVYKDQINKLEWKHFSDDYYPLKIDAGNQSFESEISSTFMYRGPRLLKKYVVEYDYTTGAFTLNEHGLANGDTLIIKSGPEGEIDNVYFVVGATTDDFKLSLESGGTAKNFTTVVDYIMYTFNSIEWLVPYISQKGSSKCFGLGDNSFNPRIVFWRGMQLDSDGEAYPLASSDIKSFNNTTVGTYSLRIKTQEAVDSGMFYKFHKEFIDFKSNTRPVTHDLNIDSLDLYNLDHSVKKRIKSNNYLLGSIKATITHSGVKPGSATGDFYTI